MTALVGNTLQYLTTQDALSSLAGAAEIRTVYPYFVWDPGWGLSLDSGRRVWEGLYRGTFESLK